jgi:hypothetical protein
VAKHRKKQAKTVAIAGAAVATAVSVAVTPGVAQALSSQTYFVGFPSWLPIGAGSTLPSDPAAINNAIVGAKDQDPLTGWGIAPGGVDLRPAWVTWIDGVPVYTLPVVGQTGTHSETIPGGTNPAYQPAYDAAYSYATVSKLIGGGGCASSNTACRTAYALNVVKNIPKVLTDTVIQVPDVGITKDGFWTATGDGEWTSPTDLSGLPAIAQLGYALAAAQNGDLSALAPLLNWTAYLTNVNLIAYGDGAIAAGVAYQAFIDSAKGDTHEGYDPYAIGTPQTGPREIALVDANGNVVKVIGYTQKVTTTVTNNPLSVPNIEYPGQPADAPDYVVTQPGGVIDLTVLSLILIRNPGTPNGGLYARFAPIYQELTGIDPVTPERQDVLPDGVDPDLIANLLAGKATSTSLSNGDLQAVLNSADGKPIIITLKANVGWEYDLLSDAPATANPVAWANSVASSVFLTNLLTGLDFQNLGNGAYVSPDGTFYYTIPVNDLPLLAPLRAPAQVLGLLTGNLDPNTPVADAIEPFLKILVNTSYTDAVRNEDGTWTRSLDEFDVPTLFGTQTLTRQQQAQVIGDLIAALGSGFGGESNQVAVDLEKQLVAALKLDVSDAQQKDIEKALITPGTALKDITREVGDGVTKALSDVEPYLPKSPIDRSQESLAKDQDAVGKVLAGARDDLNDAVASVNKTVGDVQQKNYQNQVAVRESLSKVGIKTPAPLTPAERKAKNQAAVAKTSANLKKVGDDVKKAVNDTVDKVKKAVSGD